MSDRQLLEAIAVTAEMTGTQLSPAAARAMFDDLKAYPEHQVMAALVACRRQLQHRLTLADVIARIDDGRPGPEEAWAVVSRTRDEGVTVVWTDDMRAATGVAWSLIAEGDMVAARMAFLESYRKLVQLARDTGRPVSWTVSLGHDPAGREGPIREAVSKGQLASTTARALLPLPEEEPPLPPKLKHELKRIAEKQP